jgi:hypothetical protein
MSWKEACDRGLCKLDSRFRNGKELGQKVAVQQAVEYILEGFDLGDVDSVNWVGPSHAFFGLCSNPSLQHDMFSQSTAFSQQFQTSIQEIFERRGLPHNVVAIDYSSVDLFFLFCRVPHLTSLVANNFKH